MVEKMTHDSEDADANGWLLLSRHLDDFLGVWPPARPIQLVPTLRRQQPGWDSTTRRFLGVFSPTDGTTLSVDPILAPLFKTLDTDDEPRASSQINPLQQPAEQQLVQAHHSTPRDTDTHLAYASATRSELSSVARLIEDVIGLGSGSCFIAYFRFAFKVPDLGSPGTWLPANDPNLPQWLKPFGGDVLVALDRHDRVLAGVGLKRHDRYVRELAVVTEPEARGRGLAKALVAQAAERVLQEGMLPTYLHAPNNTASARVAQATGFIDRGWRLIGLSQAGEALLDQRL
ncbi:GNAT family N-acetyltransferase [Ferrimicrobium acidiphilum]|uniref:GNAT family N-acetyltransferase n=2 Tax=Ferrimicrobium acidiphilum TaxID=121039 RepID=UPI0023F2B83C